METKNISKLQQIRKNAGLTRKELSFLSDVSDRTIEGLEQKRNSTSGSPAIIVLKLAKALNVDPWDLIEDDQDNA